MKKTSKTLFLRVVGLSLLGIFFNYTPAMAATSLVELETIYQKLIDAIGDRNNEFPKLRTAATAEMVAGYSKSSNSIVLERKAIEVCETLGDRSESAIAFLLAHELTHFYQKHRWEEANFGFLVSKQRFKNDLELEREADTYGAFIMHLAGYTINIIPEVIPKLYKAYGLLDQELSGYPTLGERQAVSNEVCHKVNNFIHIFDTANYLYSIGQLGQAAMCYEYLLNFVQCKELYANLGAACIAAAATPNSDQPFFVYPIANDFNFKLRTYTTDLERSELIEKAIQSLQKAVSYDPTYYLGFINLACAHDLAKDYSAANQLLDQLQPLVRNPDQQAQVLLTKGIVTAHQGKRERASQLFDRTQKLKTSASIQDVTRINQKILRGEHYELPTPSHGNKLSTGMIDGIDLTYEPDQIDFSFDEIVTLGSTPLEQYQLRWKTLPNSTLTLYHGSERWALQRITTSNIQTVKGIGIGNTVQQLKTSYGEPERYIIRNHGYDMVYVAKKIIFAIDTKDQISEWAVFASY